MIRHLQTEGLSISEISRQTGHDRKTVRKYLAEDGIRTHQVRKARGSILDPYKDYIKDRLEDFPFSSIRILRISRNEDILVATPQPKNLSGPSNCQNKFLRNTDMKLPREFKLRLIGEKLTGSSQMGKHGSCIASPWSSDSHECDMLNSHQMKRLRHSFRGMSMPFSTLEG